MVASDAQRQALAREAIVAALDRRRGDIQRELIAAMARAVQVYDQLSPAYRAQLEATVAYTVGIVLESWRSGRKSLTPDEAARIEEFGGGRARMRVSLTDIVAGIDQAREVGWRIALEEACRQLSTMRMRLGLAEAAQVVGSLASDLDRAVDGIRERMSAGYLHADRASRHLRERWYAALLRGTMTTDAVAAREAARLGVDVAEPAALLLIGDASGNVSAAPTAFVERLTELLAGSFVVTNPRSAVAHLIVVVPIATPQLWADALSSIGRVAPDCLVVPVSPTYPGLALLDAYLEGLRELRVMMARFVAGGRVVTRGASALGRLLSEASPQLQNELAEPVQSILALGNGAELLETIAALLRHRGMTTPAAASLNISRPTLRRRVGQIEAMTGLRLDDTDDFLILAAALFLHRLRAVSCVP